jgi:hypothetical protein
LKEDPQAQTKAEVSKMKEASKRRADIAPVAIISALLSFAALLALVACDNPAGGGSTSAPVSVSVSFDAATGSLKQSGNITLSKSAPTGQTAKVEAVAEFISYRWILDDNEVKGTGEEVILNVAALETGRHRLVLFVTDNNGVPYSSPEIVVDVNN